MLWSKISFLITKETRFGVGMDTREIYFQVLNTLTLLETLIYFNLRTVPWTCCHPFTDLWELRPTHSQTRRSHVSITGYCLYALPPVHTGIPVLPVRYTLNLFTGYSQRYRFSLMAKLWKYAEQFLANRSIGLLPPNTNCLILKGFM